MLCSIQRQSGLLVHRIKKKSLAVASLHSLLRHGVCQTVGGYIYPALMQLKRERESPAPSISTGPHQRQPLITPEMILLGLNEKSDYPWWERKGWGGGEWSGVRECAREERERGGGVKAEMC